MADSGHSTSLTHVTGQMDRQSGQRGAQPRNAVGHLNMPADPVASLEKVTVPYNTYRYTGSGSHTSNLTPYTPGEVQQRSNGSATSSAGIGSRVLCLPKIYPSSLRPSYLRDQ